MLGADGGGTQGLRVQVLPMSCQWGREVYAVAIRAISGPTGQAVPPKGPKRDGKVSGESQQKDETPSSNLFKKKMDYCLPLGYGRNSGKREGWEQRGEGNKESSLKTSETRWDWEVFLVLAVDAQLGQPAQPRTQPPAQAGGFPEQGEPSSAAGQPHMNKDITHSVTATIPDVRPM